MKYIIELIRFVSVLLITFTHTRNNFSDGWFHFVVYDLPQYGTVMLSIISGYLYFKISRNKSNLFRGKVKSLLLPYLIANSIVIIMVLIINSFGYNFLNRLTYDYTMLTEGLLSLNSPPISPPTYFIRDLFIVFVIIELITRKNLYMLLILIPVAYFGELMLRYDILIMFILGSVFAALSDKINKKYLLISLFISCIAAYFFIFDYLKFFVSFFLFVSLIDVPVKFINTGGYTYLLHLYHSPVMVTAYPIIALFIENPYLQFFMQILVVLISIYILYLLTKKFTYLKILSGGR
jgi:hypothetical protein